MANNFLTHDGLIFYDTKIKAWVQAQTNLYVLPIASGSVLGGVKVGTGLHIAADGTLSVTGVTVTWDSITGKPNFATVATSGSYNDLLDKPIIPTLVSQLSNDKNYQTEAEVASAILNAEFLSFMKVDALPSLSKAQLRTIYFVPKDVPGEDNIFEEWMVVNEQWELLGTTAIDLSNYWSKDELVEIENWQIDSLFD